jgi:Protein of unknown function (DUF1460)
MPHTPFKVFLVRLSMCSIFAATHIAGAMAAPGAARSTVATPAITQAQQQAAAKVGMSAAELERLIAKPLYRMKPAEVGRYLAYLQAFEPNLRERVAHLARKNIGQPYEIFLLGEFPYETIDDQPLFNLEKSDCLVFAENTYAMALAHSWPDFFWVLQRIRYRDGVIGVTTRNHYTDADWNPQNKWLVQDVTRELAGRSVATYTTTIDRARFFKERYKLEQAVAAETITQPYVPVVKVADVPPQLLQGDFVNVISIINGEHLVSHVGLVVLGPNGERHILHSAEPAVREETFASFIARVGGRAPASTTARESRKPGKTLVGFAFLRLNDNPAVPPMKPQPRPATFPATLPQ